MFPAEVLYYHSQGLLVTETGNKYDFTGTQMPHTRLQRREGEKMGAATSWKRSSDDPSHPQDAQSNITNLAKCNIQFLQGHLITYSAAELIQFQDLQWQTNVLQQNLYSDLQDDKTSSQHSSHYMLSSHGKNSWRLDNNTLFHPCLASAGPGEEAGEVENSSAAKVTIKRETLSH